MTLLIGLIADRLDELNDPDRCQIATHVPAQRPSPWYLQGRTDPSVTRHAGSPARRQTEFPNCRTSLPKARLGTYFIQSFQGLWRSSACFPSAVTGATHLAFHCSWMVFLSDVVPRHARDSGSVLSDDGIVEDTGMTLCTYFSG